MRTLIMNYCFDLLDFAGFCFQKKIMPSRPAFENWFRRTYHQKSETASEDGIQKLLIEAEYLLYSIEHASEDIEMSTDLKVLQQNITL